ncbi:MAG: hydantoinase/oxoprolinase family protein [Oscillospiraceae bacterium]
MSLILGIDAGGTYTDAVLYNPAAREIIASAKALTTRDDLCIGINEAVEGLTSSGLLREVVKVSLSTTLATNACVEGKGGRGKLLFIDIDEAALDWVGDTYGLPSREEFLLLTGADMDKLEELLELHGEWFADAEGIAVVDYNAFRNSAVVEKKVRDAVLRRFELPVICGHELNNELNSLRRGASTLLNVRLIPVIAEFLAAIRRSLTERGIDAPVSVVRSDGTLMTDGFASPHPVETLLCGAAAGLIGAHSMVDRPDCLVVDMGGTTTDISIIENGSPKRSGEGIRIGRWRTFAQGIFVDTFGLGGDSALRNDKNRKPYLDSRRAIPLSIASSRWPGIKEQLRELIAAVPKHTFPLHEFFVLTKEIEGQSRYSKREQDFCRGLRGGPVIFSRAAELWGGDIYNLRVERLEQEGVVQRCGLTPTDFMHLKGDFTTFDTEAARLGADFFAAGLGKTADELADLVYDMVKAKLYKGIVRVLLEQAPGYRNIPFGEETERLVEEGWRSFSSGERNLVKLRFETPFTLAGIGAPIHIFLPDVAEALSAEWAVPDNARVANALGAATGWSEASYRLEVKAESPEEGEMFVVNGPYGRLADKEREVVLEEAVRQAEQAAREELVKRSGAEKMVVRTEIKHNEAPTNYGFEVYLGSIVTAIAVAK